MSRVIGPHKGSGGENPPEGGGAATTNGSLRKGTHNGACGIGPSGHGEFVPRQKVNGNGGGGFDGLMTANLVDDLYRRTLGSHHFLLSNLMSCHSICQE